jgi:hypothetical protein
MITKSFILAKDYSLIGAKILRDHGANHGFRPGWVRVGQAGKTGSAAGPTTGPAARGLSLDVKADYFWT